MVDYSLSIIKTHASLNNDDGHNIMAPTTFRCTWERCALAAGVYRFSLKKAAKAIVRYLRWIDVMSLLQPLTVALLYGHGLNCSVGLAKVKTASCDGSGRTEAKMLRKWV